MKFYLGVTDSEWYFYLSKISPEDINFWQPGGSTKFKVILPGSPFLFKLKSPYNTIGGIGFFVSHTFLPISLAWETFKERNGTASFEEFKNKILSYRSKQNKFEVNPTIGCIVLTNPIFFNKEDWISVPQNWEKSIVQGKSYNTADAIGNKLWADVTNTLHKYLLFQKEVENKSQLILEEPEAPQYGKEVLTRVRLGQGAFRVLITDAYFRKCTISGEKTLPVLEAAHIQPYARSGPHFISNGLLLRADIHKLFDNGYITVTQDHKVEVSKRIKEEFENGKDYYKFHGKELVILPNRITDRPDKKYLEWHNQNVYNG